MESAIEYLMTKHKTLSRDYGTPDGRYSESCSIIAIEMARRLLAEGISPELYKITGKHVDEVNTATLTPKPFDGRVTWGAHIVCGAQGMIYDPLLHMPTPIAEYCAAVFDTAVDMTVCGLQGKMQDVS